MKNNTPIILQDEEIRVSEIRALAEQEIKDISGGEIVIGDIPFPTFEFTIGNGPGGDDGIMQTD